MLPMKYSSVIILIWASLTILVFSGLASDSLNGYRSVIGKSFKYGAKDRAGPRRVLLSDSKFVYLF